MLNKLVDSIYICHILRYERSGIIRERCIHFKTLYILLIFSYSELEYQMGATHVMKIVWIYKMPLCNAAFMQEVESVFTTNVGTVHRKEALMTTNYGTRNLTYRCTSMYDIGIPSHSVRPKSKTKSAFFVKTAFIGHSCPMLNMLCRHYIDAELCHISSMYLLRFEQWVRSFTLKWSFKPLEAQL